MYNYKLVNDIEQYINDELAGCQYYIELSKNAISEISKKVLQQFSLDEMEHAENFKLAYYYLSDKMYIPEPIKNIKIPAFEEALKVRFIIEKEDYKKYGEQYIYAQNSYIKDLFFRAKIVEAQHAMRIPMLFCDEI